MAKMKTNGVGFTLIEMLIVMAVIAILATIAIPSFNNYIRNSKTVEALESLNKVNVGARIYYREERKAPNGITVGNQFPGGPAVLTPDVPCCESTTAPKCPKNPSKWEQATWRSLKFQISDAHYYRYSFVSAGTNTAATFTAAAFGNLDCDTQESSFRYLGRVDPEYGVTQAGPIIQNKLE